MSMKKQILGVIDDWIYCTQDDLCHYFDPSRREPFTENEIRCIHELNQRRIDLFQFKRAFELDIEVGETAYSRALLAEVVSAIISGENDE